MSVLRLYHTGFQVIETPDLKIGRKNADFGQGFYLSDDREFSRRWARERRGQATYVNAYELETEELRIKGLDRDGEWFSCIYANRTNQGDPLPDYDVIIGPIANDTMYDTWGILTSGMLAQEQVLRLLMLGPKFTQTVIKTEKAAAALRFLGAEEMGKAEIAANRETVRAEEAQYQEAFVRLLSEITGVDITEE